MSDIGISTACFYPMYTEKALQKITNFNVPVCEIFFNCFSEMDINFIKKLKKIADSKNLKITSIHPFLSGLEGFLFFSEYKRRVDDGIDIYKRHFEAAAVLGAKYFVFHGALNSSSFCGMECYIERYKRIYDVAKTFGVTVTHENVSRTVSATVDFVKEFKKAMGSDASFTFDLKQCIRASQDPLEFIQAMGDKIRHVHINDFDFEKKECRLPCEGNCDISGIIGSLKSTGYDGDYIVEVYSDNYKSEDDIAASLKKLSLIF